MPYFIPRHSMMRGIPVEPGINSGVEAGSAVECGLDGERYPVGPGELKEPAAFRCNH